ncbi:hypothetical protein J8281_03555 [Aquimarina sp. U1-2]|uniref:hypothetical protein n=1 Tax=Aquimarina sp. U1-2 TaxID=2823141 RepID=UPI001AEC7C7C|nr:hypothetical protein [Aquimarina sp. U1-2]MBP2831254.1 hypothetical protein [Aquimarina sp. U1-2]
MIRYPDKTLQGAALIIKRRFIPIRLEVTQPGQYLNFSLKLPHDIQKVAGLIITSRVANASGWIDRFYVGSSPCEIDVGTFTRESDNAVCIEDLNTGLLNQGEGFRLQVQVKEDERLHYAQPKRLGSPKLKINGNRHAFHHPQETWVQALEACEGETYRLWKSKNKGLGEVWFEVIPMPDSDGDDDNEDDD